MALSEFTVAGTYQYNRRGPRRWIASHLLRYRRLVAAWVLTAVAANVINATIPTLIGRAFNVVLAPHTSRNDLLTIALVILGAVLVLGAFDLVARSCDAVLGKRLERDCRDEFYLSLLSKSQTFHNRQRVGDLMARATNDTQALSDLMVPGVDLIVDSFLALIVPIIFIGFINPVLLVAPLAFAAAFLLALRRYTRELNPVSGEMRWRFGEMNAALAETITGIEVVKSSAQEAQERRKFAANARLYRNAFVKNGQIQARYLPPLLLAVAMVGAFLLGLFLVTHGQLSVGSLVAYMGLMSILRFPSFISIFSFALVQLGVAGAGRILAVMEAETELDEQATGHRATLGGELAFAHVTFHYEGNGVPALSDVSFTAAPGQTIAIVGQTGSGKTTLAKLVNRTYDVGAGRVLIDGVDVREWSLDALRSQISTIEQDVFLFSRTIAENIGFGLGQQVDRAAIVEAAKQAQAHDFIMSFHDGYDTVVGERGITLSGGQRQRLAIARALLTNPRILILDDSTSAIDSATEDEIQQAIRRVLEGRTTLLITHRLSQIRQADKILVLRAGALVDQGSHDELLARSETYRRIFAHYDPGTAVARTGAAEALAAE
ncbi:MAG TPA: ABC transporter ATP-binding protein [Ktedonobacterales bacterium]|nr:ABC transporter ATP-binding protein [Ktedonobacterales bacterium]